MKNDTPNPIPIPLVRRWHTVRMRLLPALVFAAVVAMAAWLWKDHVGAPVMVGQAEPVVANVSCHRPGVLTELTVTRYQKVKAGDTVGRVMVTEPRILAAALAVFQSEIEQLRTSLRPIADRQRTAMDYDTLRLDWMRQRAQLGQTRANLQFAESDFHRMEQLFTDKIISQRMFEQAKATRDRLQIEETELARLTSECETNLHSLEVTNSLDLSKVTSDPLTAAINVEEAKLRQTEVEMSPVAIHASIDGVVTEILHRPGEAVTIGEPIIALSTLNPARIIGYLRPPILQEPKVGAPVTIRTRGLRHATGSATILEVGTQLEAVPPTVLGPVNFANVVQGLPVGVSVPTNFRIHPGEVVDILWGGN